MSIIEKAEELNFKFGTDFRIQKACFAAEPLLPNVRETLEKKYGIDTYTMYGATEVGDIGFGQNAGHTGNSSKKRLARRYLLRNKFTT